MSRVQLSHITTRCDNIRGNNYVWCDSVIHVTWLTHKCVTWLVYMWDTYAIYTGGVWERQKTRTTCDATHLYAWHDSYIYGMTHLYAWHESYIYGMTHLYAWHDSYMYMAWLIYTCDLFIFVTWRFQMDCENVDDNNHVWCDSFICIAWLIHVWRDSFVCVTWRIQVDSENVKDNNYTVLCHRVFKTGAFLCMWVREREREGGKDRE